MSDRPQRVQGVGRIEYSNEFSEQTLWVSFTQPITNDDVRSFHEYARLWRAPIEEGSNDRNDN